MASDVGTPDRKTWKSKPWQTLARESMLRRGVPKEMVDMVMPEEPDYPPVMIDDGESGLHIRHIMEVRKAVRRGRTTKEHPAGAYSQIVPPRVEEVMLYCQNCGRHRVANLGEECPVCMGHRS